MIDNFALALSHGLLLLAAWRLMFRRDLEDDSVPVPARPVRRGRWADDGAVAEERPDA